MTMTRDEVDRFLGLNEELAQATLRCIELSSMDRDETEQVAFEWALYCFSVCIGKCKMYAVSPIRAAEFAIPRDHIHRLFYCAWQEIQRIGAMLKSESNESDGLLQGAADAIESEFTSLDVLESRLDFEGLRSVFRDKQLLTVTDENAHRQRTEVYEQLLTEFDEQIDEHCEELANVADTAWPANVAAMLPTESYQPRPWWLKGEAMLILQSHRSLVSALMSPKVGEVLTVEADESSISHRWRDANRFGQDDLHTTVSSKSELLRSDTADYQLSIAADAQIGPSLDRLATYVGRYQATSVRTTLYLSRQYDLYSLLDLNDATEFLLHLIVTRKVGPSENAGPERWKMRWATMIVEATVDPLASSLLPGTRDWQCELRLSMADLRAVIGSDQWPAQYWRRIG